MILAGPAGGALERVAEAPGTFYYGVVMKPGGEALLVGWAGSLATFDAQNQLTALEGPTTQTLRAAALFQGQLLVAGEGGTAWQTAAGPTP